MAEVEMHYGREQHPIVGDTLLCGPEPERQPTESE